MSRICTLAERQARACIRERTESIPALCVRVPDGSAETVHELRVACRRIRVTLSEFTRSFPPSFRREMRNLLRGIRRGLGLVREIDVNLECLQRFREKHPDAAAYLAVRLEKRRQEALHNALESPRFPDADTFNALVGAINDGIQGTAACYRKQAERRLTKRLKKLSHQYRAWKTTNEADDLHATRIELKKLRYALEVYVHLYGAEGRALLAEIHDAQDVLGDWNDLRNLARHLVRYHETAPPGVAESLSSLLEDVENATAEKLETAIKVVKRVLKKNRRDDMKRLFGKPQRPCCDRRNIL